MALIVGVNTYSTLQESDDYFLTRYNSNDWISLDDSVKEILKQSAARALDLFCDWQGSKHVADQKLAFPRESGTIPDEVKIAENEIAFSIMQSENVSNEEEPNLIKLKADVIELGFGKVSSVNSIYGDFTTRLLTTLCGSTVTANSQLVRV